MKKILISFALLTAYQMSLAQIKPVEVSHYLFPDFTQGTILMKNGTQRSAQLNYNSMTEEMVFEERGQRLAISEADMQRIDSVFIEGRIFVIINQKFKEVLINDSYILYAEHKCNVVSPGKPAAYGGRSHSSTSTSYGRITTSAGIYELKLPDGYEAKPYIVYWLRKSDQLERFANVRQLRRLYSDKRNELRDYTRRHDVDFNNQDDVKRLIRFLEKTI